MSSGSEYLFHLYAHASPSAQPVGPEQEHSGADASIPVEAGPVIFGQDLTCAALVVLYRFA